MSKERSQPPYKQVMIFGPDDDGAFQIDFERAKNLPDCLIIGDLEKEVTLEEIHDALYGKIDSATRIDINAHGGVGKRYLLVGEERHVVGLSTSDFDLGTETQDLFKVFS
ncbi:MAG: hypothetical protein KBC27_01815 [Rickettsiales bacterium]|nr:hypothetical protein [Rickettsiales bacterium]